MRVPDLFPARKLSAESLGRNLEMAGVVLLLLYLLAGVIYSAVLPAVARFSDEDDYLKLSYNLLHGPGYSMDGINLTASRPPGYAFFLFAIRAMGGDFFSFRVVQFLLLGGTVFLVSRLCAEKKAFASLFVVTLLVICYPVLFYTSATLYPQILSGFLFVLALTLTLAAPRGLLLNLATGCCFGALILEVPTFLFTMVIVLVTVWILKIFRWRDVLLVGLAASLFIGGWTWRNASRFHRFVPIASNSGMNFLIGNNEKATAYEAVANAGLAPYAEQADKLEMDEFQSDHYFQQVAVDWIKTHPTRAVVLYFEKVLNFFNIVNVYAPHSREEISTWKQVVMATSYLILLGLLGWRLAEIRRFPLIPREILFLAVYVLSAFTAAIFFTRIRFRLPYDYLLIAVIALHLSRHLKIWTSARQSPKLFPASADLRGQNHEL